MEMNDMRRMSHEAAECIRLPNHLLRTRWPTRFAIEAQFREGEFGNAQSVVRRLPLDRIIRHKRNVIGKYVATAYREQQRIAIIPFVLAHHLLITHEHYPQ